MEKQVLFSVRLCSLLDLSADRRIASIASFIPIPVLADVSKYPRAPICFANDLPSFLDTDGYDSLFLLLS